MMTGGIRTPVDIVVPPLPRRYGEIDAETARVNRERGLGMSVSDAVAWRLGRRFK